MKLEDQAERKAREIAGKLYPKDTESHDLRRIGCQSGFMYGVGWAFGDDSPLLSAETVERVARAMHRHDVNEGIVVAAWGSSLGQDDDYRRAARAALNAAVGGS